MPCFVLPCNVLPCLACWPIRRSASQSVMVVVRARKVRWDCWQELVPPCELLVVLQDLPLASLAPNLHANPDGRPRSVECLLLDALQDPVMDVVGVRRGPQAIVRTHEEQVREKLLRRGVQGLLFQSLFDALGQLLEVADVDVLSHLWCVELTTRSHQVLRRLRRMQGLAGPSRAFKCWLPLSRSGYEGRLYVICVVCVVGVPRMLCRVCCVVCVCVLCCVAHVSLCAINTMSATAISAPGAISVISTMSDTNTRGRHLRLQLAITCRANDKEHLHRAGAGHLSKATCPYTDTEI